MKILTSRIYEKQKKKKEEALASKRKSLVGSGDRSEKLDLITILKEELLIKNQPNTIQVRRCFIR